MKRIRPITRSASKLVTSKPSDLKFSEDAPPLVVPPPGHVFKAKQFVAAYYDDEKAWFVGEIKEVQTKEKEAEVFFFLDQTFDTIPFTELRLCIPTNEIMINPFISLADEFIESSKRFKVGENTGSSFGLILPWGIVEIGMVLRVFLTDTALGHCLSVCKAWKVQVDRVWPEEEKEFGKLEYQEYLHIKAVESTKGELGDLEAQIRTLTLNTPKVPRRRKGETEKKKLTPAQEQRKKEIASEKRVIRKQQTELRARHGSLCSSLSNIQMQIKNKRLEMYLHALPKELQTFNIEIPAIPIWPNFRKVLVVSSGLRLLTPEEIKDGYCAIYASLKEAISRSCKGDKIFLESGIFPIPSRIWDEDSSDEDSFGLMDVEHHLEIIGLGADKSSTITSDAPTTLLAVHRCCVVVRNISFIQGNDYFDPEEESPFICVRMNGSLWLQDCQITFGTVIVYEGSKLFLENSTFKDSEQSPITVHTDADSVVIQGCEFSKCCTRASQYAVHVFRPYHWRISSATTAKLHLTIRKTKFHENAGHAVGAREPTRGLGFHPFFQDMSSAPTILSENLILENNSYSDNKGCNELCNETKLCVAKDSDDESSDDDMMFPGHMYRPYYSDSDSDSEDGDEMMGMPPPPPFCSVM